MPYNSVCATWELRNSWAVPLRPGEAKEPYSDVIANFCGDNLGKRVSDKPGRSSCVSIGAVGKEALKRYERFDQTLSFPSLQRCFKKNDSIHRCFHLSEINLISTVYPQPGALLTRSGKSQSASEAVSSCSLEWDEFHYGLAPSRVAFWLAVFWVRGVEGGTRQKQTQSASAEFSCKGTLNTRWDCRLWA